MKKGWKLVKKRLALCLSAALLFTALPVSAAPLSEAGPVEVLTQEQPQEAGNPLESPLAQEAGDLLVLPEVQEAAGEAGDLDGWDEEEFGEGALDDDFEIITHPEEMDELEAVGDSLPASYNAAMPADVSKLQNVSLVRSQGCTGLCWMFGAVAAVESNLLKKYNEYKVEDMNLSEKFGAYWVLHQAEGSYGGWIDNDYVELINDPKTSYDQNYTLVESNQSGKENGYLRRGGNNWLSAQAFASGRGLVDEDTRNELKYENSGTVKLMADEPALPDQGVTVPYHSEYQVQQIHILPYGLRNKRGERQNTEEGFKAMVEKVNAGALDEMKQAIMDYGSLAGSMNTDFFDRSRTYVYHPGDPYETQDSNRRSGTTHIVNYVGWDDNVPKELFANPSGKDDKLSYYDEKEFTPPANGAWICKNSWGTKSGKNGFFYVSYYDGSLRNLYNSFAGYEVVSKEKDEGKFFDHEYQYDGIFNRAGINVQENNHTETGYGSPAEWFENGKHFGALYTAQKKEKLGAVGIFTREQAMKYKVNIYTRVSGNEQDKQEIKIEDLKAPNWEHKVTDKEFIIPQAGYHTLKLDTPVALEKGQQYLVMFEMDVNPERGKGMVMRQIATEDTYFAVRRTSYQGRKYYIGSEHYHKKASGYSFDDLVSTNSLSFRSDLDYDIKAYTMDDVVTPPEPETSYLEFYSDYENQELEVGGTVDMAKGLIFEPVSKNGTYDAIKEWTSSNEGILKNLTGGSFKAVSEGNAVITVSTNYGASVSTNVIVTQWTDDPKAEYRIEFTGEDALTYNGEWQIPEFRVLSDNKVLKTWDKYENVSADNVLISVSVDSYNEGYVPGMDAGDAYLTVDLWSLSNNEPVSFLTGQSMPYEIKPLSLEDAYDKADLVIVEPKEVYDYTGSEIRPKPLLYYRGVSLNEANDYTVQYLTADLKEPGMKYMLITGTWNYEGNLYVSYRIKEKDEQSRYTDTENGIYVGEISSMPAYDGNKHVVDTGEAKKSGYTYDLSLDVRNDGKNLTPGVDYKLSYYNNVAATFDGMASGKQPYVLVTGLGKYKGLKVKRYFGIAPAELGEDSTLITGIKAVYPYQEGKTISLKPVVTWEFEDATGKIVKRKLKQAVTKKGKLTGDYQLKFYRYRFPEGDEEEIPGEEEEPDYGEWLAASANGLKPAEGETQTYYLCVAEGMGNYQGTSVALGEAYPYPWPGAEAQFLVTNKANLLPEKSLVNLKVPEDMKKLTQTKKEITGDELASKTTVDLQYKDASGRKASKTVTSDGKDLYSYITLYDPSEREQGSINTPGKWKLRIIVTGTLPAGTMKDQTTDLDIYATKDFAFKVTSGLKLKKANFTLSCDGAGNGDKATLSYNGLDNQFTLQSKDAGLKDGVDYEVANASVLTENSSPGKYTVKVAGCGAYAGSSVKFTFTRKKLPLKDAVSTNRGSLWIDVMEPAVANANGTAPVIRVHDGYDPSRDGEIDLSEKTASSNLVFTVRNNKGAGQGKGVIVVKPGKGSPYSGSVTIKFDILKYDLAKQGGEILMLSENGISDNAADHACRVYAIVGDAYSASAVPAVRLVQYDKLGIESRQLLLTKDNLAADGKGMLTIKGDKAGILALSADGVKLPYRVMEASSKAKKIEITEGDASKAVKEGMAHTGKPLCPSVTKVTADGTVLELAKGEFEVSYENNVKAGTGSITVKITKAGVSGLKTFKFKIK